MSFDLADYVEVPERVQQFYAKYPDGRIQADPVQIVNLGDRVFLAVTARAYRTETDPVPCVAQAWEPFPGRTPYTKDSEAMNAETSAIGRALSAAGIAAGRKFASRDEVAARMADREAKPAKRAAAPKKATTGDALTRRVMAQFTQLGITERPERLHMTSEIVGRDVESWKDVTPDEAKAVTAELERRLSARLDVDEPLIESQWDRDE